MRWKGTCRLSCRTTGLKGLRANGLDKGLMVDAVVIVEVQAIGKSMCSDFRTSFDHSRTAHKVGP